MSQDALHALSETLVYTISFPEPTTHRLEVELRFAPRRPGPVDLTMPAWTPGSYKIREYARHVQDVVAADAGTATPLPVEKVDKQTWRITPGASGVIVVSYRVYANELTVRTNQVDDEKAFWNGAATCLHVRGETDRQAQVTVKDLPDGWTIATQLDPVEGVGGTYVAADHDALIDAPFLCGKLHGFSFEVDGIDHQFLFLGEGNMDLERLARDVPRIVEAERDLMGGLPYRRYAFLTILGDVGGGLEHKESTILGWRRFDFRPEERYLDYLGLVSHELFHVWNGKRLRPRELGPFDLSTEVHTKGLWVVEGVTSYYDELLCHRAGVYSEAELLKRLAKRIEQLRDTPGRRRVSLEESSFDAWTRYYIRDEGFPNVTVSYYEKGQLVAWLLDLAIRARTRGERSLDDVMRLLWARFPEDGPGYTTAEVEAAAAEVAGASLDAFFSRYTRGTVELGFEAVLGTFGLELAREPEAGREAVSELGATLDTRGRFAVVGAVLEGRAAWRAGLCPKDEIILVDGYKVEAKAIDGLLGERAPGGVVRLAGLRGDRWFEVAVTLGRRDRAPLLLRRIEDASERQRGLLEGWLAGSKALTATAG